MQRILKIAVLVVCCNALIALGQKQSPPSQPVNSGIPTYLLEPVETAAAIYPAAATKQRVQGETVARFIVSETGAVERIYVLKGNRLLASAALEALQKWRFKPVIVDGDAITLSSLATFNFVLDNDHPNPSEVMPTIASAVRFPNVVRVASKVVAGFLISKVAPVYPDTARAERIQGVVVLHAFINKDGTMGDLQLVSGPPELAASAIEAVKQWRYRPYLLNGQPVEMETQIPVDFTLEGR